MAGALAAALYGVAAVVLPAWVAASELEHRYDDVIAAAIAEASGRYEVPVALVKAIIRQESAFRADAVSPAGARGLMQVMPSTAARFGVDQDRLFEPAENIRVGVRLLASLLERYEGDVISTLIAYNAGPQAPLAPIPRNAETPGYVWRVLGFYERYSGVPAENWADAAAPNGGWPLLRSTSLGAPRP